MESKAKYIRGKYTPAALESSVRWKKSSREQIAIDVPKGDKVKLQAVAKAEGLSLRAFVLDALDEKYSQVFPEDHS